MKTEVHKAEIRLNLQDLETDLPYAIGVLWFQKLPEIWYCTNPQGKLSTQMSIISSFSSLSIAHTVKSESNFFFFNKSKDFASLGNIASYQDIEKDKPNHL